MHKSSSRLVLLGNVAQTTPQRTAVSENLAEALRHLRYAERSGAVWVNVICISQLNGYGKGRQVRHMGGVYDMIDRVAPWLGPASADSGLAISTLK